MWLHKDNKQHFQGGPDSQSQVSFSCFNIRPFQSLHLCQIIQALLTKNHVVLSQLVPLLIMLSISDPLFFRDSISSIQTCPCLPHSTPQVHGMVCLCQLTIHDCDLSFLTKFVDRYQTFTIQDGQNLRLTPINHPYIFKRWTMSSMFNNPNRQIQRINFDHRHSKEFYQRVFALTIHSTLGPRSIMHHFSRVSSSPL